ncbi:MAG: hypothetical protein ACFBSG_13240 [Leptolyngbyaceae cyanobacterium]
MPMSQYHLLRGGLASLAHALFFHLLAPSMAAAATPLLQADVESFRNRVDLVLRGGPTRPIRPSDRLGFGDSIRTGLVSQIDLHFNDGSFARVGELAIFGFVPQTRTLQLTAGTALFLIPPGQGGSTIETPTLITTTGEAALVVRHFAAPPSALELNTAADSDTAMAAPIERTAVIVLSDGDGGPLNVRLRDGRNVDLSAGQMAIVDGDNLYVFAFDLALFYETSPFVQGLFLAEPNHDDNNAAIAAIRQAIMDDLQEQPGFTGEYLLDPQFLAPDGNLPEGGGWLFPNGDPARPPNSEPIPEERPSQEADNLLPSPHESTDLEQDLTEPLAPDTESGAPTNESDISGDDLPAGVIIPGPDLAPETDPAPN